MANDAGSTNQFNFKQGDFCHIELPVKDKERAKKFYGEVFGWKFNEMPNYTLFETPGRVVGGGLFTPSENMPNKVINYLTVDSIEQAAKKINAMGGKTVSPKIDVQGHGSMMHFTDPEGNLVALWEPSK